MSDNKTIYYFLVFVNCNKHEPILLRVSIKIEELFTHLKNLIIGQIKLYKLTQEELDDPPYQLSDETVEEVKEDKIYFYQIPKEEYQSVANILGIDQHYCDPRLLILQSDGEIGGVIDQAQEFII